MSNHFSKNFLNLFSYSLICCICYFPKISLVDFLDYRQGIRFEDLLAFTYGAFLICFFKEQLKIKFFLLFGIFFYLIFVNIYSTILNFKIEWIINARLIEYIIISYGIYFAVKSGLIKSNFFSIYIYLNTLLALLQYFHIIGAFASFGYLESTHGWLARPYGLTGGPWELGATTILASLCYLHLSKKHEYIKHEYILVQFCTLICVILAGTRANIIAYFVILTFLNFQNLRLNILSQLLIIFVAITIFTLLMPNTLDRIYGIFDIPLEKIYKSDFSLPSILNILGADPSLAERFKVWTNSYLLWTSNWVSFVFGIGWHNLYMESFIFRVIFSFGIVGVITLTYYIFLLDFPLIVFLLFCGLTLDLFVSIKIFCLFSIYLALTKFTDASETVPA